MKRRDFIKTGAAAVGLAGLLPPLLADEANPAKPSDSPGLPPADNRPPEYLRRVRQDKFLPKPPQPGTYQISPMPLAERLRRNIVPRRGCCSIAPGGSVGECLISGNGAMNIELMGDPVAEQILFHHESLLMPWKRPLEAPKIADIFSQVRQMIMEGRDRDAMELVGQRINQGPLQDTQPHQTIPAFLMRLEFSKTSPAKDYLRTVNFETGEANVYWTDDRGDWVRENFVSRPDNLVVQRLTAPAGRTMDVRISLQKSAEWTMNPGITWGNRPATRESKGVEAGDVRQDSTEQRLIYKCRLDPSVDNSGYAGVTRVVITGGSARMDGGTLAISDAASVMLLTRIEYFQDYSEDKVEALRQAVESISPDYTALLDRHQRVQAEMLNRVTVNFGGASQHGMSNEELLTDQRSRPDFSPALLEKIHDMGRYWFILNSGKYPSIAPGVDTTINLQTAAAVQGDMREGMEAYFSWMESLAPDVRVNAANIFGFRGALYPLFPDKGVGACLSDPASPAIGLWPYWISAGGWCLRPFWDHFLVTGDVDFLRNRTVPAYKALAQFYEDFLTAADTNGNYVFAPSFSPKNTPVSSDASGPTSINATMDIAVCREVLTNLIQACELLGTDADSVGKWKAILAKMPPYLTELDGTLKEWAWPTLQERYSHRHVSHLYGAWPGDEINLDRTPQLARAAEIAVRRRTFDTMSVAVAGETLPAYARCHRALAGARLKDNVIVGIQLRQLLEQGYVSASLRCSREPYGGPVPDAHGGIPAILMEMLAYSRPGVIEVLPALPQSLLKGSVKGMLARTAARIDNLTWDMDARTVDMTITSLKNQDVTLIARHGIESISAPAGGGAAIFRRQPPSACLLTLPAGQPVRIQLTLGRRNPLEWVSGIASA